MKNKNKKKTSMKMGIIVAILLLAVGFAAVSTVLVINGTIKIKPDEADFEKNVVFKTAKVSKEGGPNDESNIPSANIENGSKKITFTTQTMKDIGEKSILTYTIENKSQYAAKITGITCEQIKESEADDDHIQIIADKLNDIILQPKEVTEEKKVTVEMIKSYVGAEESTTKTITFTCTIQAEAQEATTTE